MLLFGKVQVGDALPTLEVPVTARTVVMGASSSRDWQPQHHDYAWATTRAGTKDIFLNTPNQAGWFRMRRPVYPGETLVFNGTVRETAVDESSCAWVDVDIELTVGEDVATEASARLAIPQDDKDNPWRRSGDDWRP